MEGLQKYVPAPWRVVAASSAVSGVGVTLMSRFFIDRPIFAWVIAIVIMLAGPLAIRRCRSRSIRPSPRRDQHQRHLSRAHPRRRSRTRVTQVIEQQHERPRHLLYMSSSERSSGDATITLTFEPGDRSGHRAGAGAEQVAARHAARCRRKCSARACRSPRRGELPDGPRPSCPSDGSMTRRHRGLHRLQPPGSDQPRARRRRCARLRRAIRDAHLARPGQANSFQLTPADVQRR